MEQRTTPDTSGQSSNRDGQTRAKNRKHRRAEKSVKRKNAAGVNAARIEELRKAWLSFSTQIVQQVEGIRVAFNKNHKAYSEAFSNLDARISVMQAVINDVHSGSPIETSEGNIDWEAYLTLYKQHLKDILDKEKEASQAAEGVSADIVDELREEVYGGDYGTGTQELGDRQVSEGVEAEASEDATGDEQGGSSDEHSSRSDADEVHEMPRDDEADESG